MGYNTRMMRGWMIALILIGLIIPRTALSAMYYWVDDQGIEYYTAERESIPEQYRSKAKALSLTDAPPVPVELKPDPKAPIKIPFSPGSPVLVRTKINGVGPFTLILDTGADGTMISPSVLSKSGFSSEAASPAVLKGVTGTACADRVWVDSLEVGGAKIGPLLIIAHDVDMKGVDGLLGRDFLAGFDVTIDSKQHLVTLSPH